MHIRIIKKSEDMKTLIISLLILCTTLMSCKKDTNNENNNIKADYQIAVNESFQVNLVATGNDGGYRWAWLNKKSITIVDSIDYDFILNNTDTLLNGDGGTEIWIFKGKKIGTQIIKLVCKQPWDPNSTIETKNIIVKVK